MNFRPSKHDRATFGKIASQYNLTYFGTVMPDQQQDYLPVRGMTASPEQVDDNYTAGRIAGFPVQLLQRSHDVYLRDNRRVRRVWTITQIDLPSPRWPHAIIGGKDKQTGEESILASYLRMYEINLAGLGPAVAPEFIDKFAVYISPQDIDYLPQLLTPDIQAMLALHFADHDFEIDGDKLYVYSTSQPLTVITLDRQLRIAIWLAKQLAK